jgi:peptide chain release factor 1
MWAKLDQMLTRYRDIETLMSQPDIVSDGARLSTLAKEHGSLAKVVKPYLQHKELAEEISQAEQLAAAEADPDMRAYAQEELKGLRQKEADLRAKLEDLLLVDPGEDFDSIILEIRAGTGGDEAALFARNLFEMYQHYAQDRGWKVEVMDMNATDLGGFKEVVASINGEGVYRALRYESGGHRVQRVPDTETQGRIHTSAATVAVLPEPTEIQIEIKPEDIRVDTFSAGGPGGQHQNKTQSGVRLVHLPTGVVAESRTERSQHKNKAQCWRMLRTRIYEQMLEKERASRAAERKSQIGSGDRSERIRTYNFPQNRITDHRINLTLYKLDSVMQGRLDEMLRALMDYDKKQQFEAMAAESKVAVAAK